MATLLHKFSLCELTYFSMENYEKFNFKYYFIGIITIEKSSLTLMYCLITNII